MLYLRVRLNKINYVYLNIILYPKYFYKPHTVGVGGKISLYFKVDKNKI